MVLRRGREDHGHGAAGAAERPRRGEDARGREALARARAPVAGEGRDRHDVDEAFRRYLVA